MTIFWQSTRLRFTNRFSWQFAQNQSLNIFIFVNKLCGGLMGTWVRHCIYTLNSNVTAIYVCSWCSWYTQSAISLSMRLPAHACIIECALLFVVLQQFLIFQILICSKLVDRIDKDHDGKVTMDELKEWIKITSKRYIYDDVERQWNHMKKMEQSSLSSDKIYAGVRVLTTDPISWEKYRNLTYGYITGELYWHPSSHTQVHTENAWMPEHSSFKLWDVLIML